MKDSLISVLVVITLVFSAIGSLAVVSTIKDSTARTEAIVATLQSQNTDSEAYADSYGAATGPEMPFRYLSVGGLKSFYSYSKNLIQATSSVICSIASPAGTSTLEDGGITLTTATSSGTSLSATKSTAPYVLGSVVIASSSVASGAYATQDVASSTWNQTAINDRIFPPNTYLVFSQLGGGILNQSGSCFARFTTF